MSVQTQFRAYRFKKLLENAQFFVDCILDNWSISNESRTKTKLRRKKERNIKQNY